MKCFHGIYKLKNIFFENHNNKIAKIDFVYELSPFYQKSVFINFQTKYRIHRKRKICFEKLMRRRVFFVITVI